jgi:hypothetical protein
VLVGKSRSINGELVFANSPFFFGGFMRRALSFLLVGLFTCVMMSQEKIRIDPSLSITLLPEWEKLPNERGTEILRNEGIFAESYLYAKHSTIENFYFIVSKAQPDMMFSEAFLEQNRLNRARTHYNLDPKWGYAKVVNNVFGSNSAVITLGLSKEKTSHQFPAFTVGVWVDFVRPYFNKKDNKAEINYYEIYYRIPSNQYDKLKGKPNGGEFIEKYIKQVIHFEPIGLVPITSGVYNAMEWMKKNGFVVNLKESQPAVEDKAAKPKPVEVAVFESISMDGNKVREYFEDALKKAFFHSNGSPLIFMPGHRVRVLSGRVKSDSFMDFKAAEAYFEKGNMVVKDAEKNIVSVRLDSINPSSIKAKRKGHLIISGKESKTGKEIQLDLVIDWEHQVSQWIKRQKRSIPALEKQE